MKKAKIVLIVIVVLLILGAVFLKYVKPKLDERKEAARIKAAETLAKASATSTPTTDAAALAAALPSPMIGVGGTVVETK